MRIATHDSETVEKSKNLLSAMGKIFVLAMLIGCKPVEVVHVPTIHTVETIIRDTIVEVRIPEHYAERETLDTISELSNPFAYSRAEVNQGKLTHTLGTRGSVTERVQVVETIIRDSIAYPVEVEVIREVDKPRRWWEKSLMWLGGAAILYISAYMIWLRR